MTKSIPLFVALAFGIAAGHAAIAAGPQAASAPTPETSALPQMFANTEVAAKVRGRQYVALPFRGVAAWVDPNGASPAWYVDSVRGIAGTHEGFFRLGDRKLKPLDKAARREFHRDMASRLTLPPALQETFGTGRRELVLLTAFDCEGCAWLQGVLAQHAHELDVRIHYLIGTLDPGDEDSMETVRAITCAPSPTDEYAKLAKDEDHEPPEPPQDCVGLGGAFGYAVTLLGANYTPWLIDRQSGEVIPFSSLDEDTIAAVLNGKQD